MMQESTNFKYLGVSTLIVIAGTDYRVALDKLSTLLVSPLIHPLLLSFLFSVFKSDLPAVYGNRNCQLRYDTELGAWLVSLMKYALRNANYWQNV